MKTLNLIYDNWQNNEPQKNGIDYLENKRLFDSEEIINHINHKSIENELVVKKCKLENIKENEKYYYIISYNAPILSILYELNQNVIDAVQKYNNLYLVYLSEHEYVDESEFIEVNYFLKNKGIDLSKIYLINNNSKLDEYKIKYLSRINVYKINYILFCKIRDFRRDANFDFTINKKGKFFLSLNKSIRTHRFAMLSILKTKKILDDTNWSFLDKNQSINLSELMNNKDVTNNINSINYFEALDYKLSDFEEQNEVVKNINEHSTILAQSENANTYKNSYVNIITETIFNSNLNVIHITEKSYKPFFYYQFPIIFASPNHIKKMRELYNFDFFDDLIDHSYDSEENNIKRFSMIINEIEKINNNKEKFIEFYENNQERFENNKNKTLSLLNYINEDYNFFKNLI